MAPNMEISSFFHKKRLEEFFRVTKKSFLEELCAFDTCRKGIQID